MESYTEKEVIEMDRRITTLAIILDEFLKDIREDIERLGL